MPEKRQERRKDFREERGFEEDCGDEQEEEAEGGSRGFWEGFGTFLRCFWEKWR